MLFINFLFCADIITELSNQAAAYLTQSNIKAAMEVYYDLAVTHNYGDTLNYLDVLLNGELNSEPYGQNWRDHSNKTEVIPILVKQYHLETAKLRHEIENANKYSEELFDSFSIEAIGNPVADNSSVFENITFEQAKGNAESLDRVTFPPAADDISEDRTVGNEDDISEVSSDDEVRTNEQKLQTKSMQEMLRSLSPNKNLLSELLKMSTKREGNVEKIAQSICETGKIKQKSAVTMIYQLQNPDDAKYHITDSSKRVLKVWKWFKDTNPKTIEEVTGVNVESFACVLDIFEKYQILNQH